MYLTRKQQKFINAFRSGRYKYFCAAGTTGSGKTFVGLALLNLLCLRVPGSRFFVGRKSEKNLKQNTIPSFTEMTRKTGTSKESVVIDMKVKYRNGSEIVLIWCDETKDPDLNNIKGLEVNGGLFEEGNQISRRHFELAKTRIAGRWRNDLGIPPFLIVTLNPSIGWVKDLFYDPWASRCLAKKHYFEEFDLEDTRQASGDGAIDTLNDLARPEYERFVMNRWNYSEMPNQLISFEWYKQCVAPEPEEIREGRTLGATDPAWDGDDPTGFAMMNKNHLGWWELHEKQDPDTSGILAYDKIKLHNIKQGDWIVDPVGVGSATVLRLRNYLKYEPDLFYGNAPAVNMFGLLPCFNKRSEANWLLRECMRQNEITFTDHPDFKKQCLNATYYLEDKQIRILEKKKMKVGLGNVSPTHLDLGMMLVHKWKTESSGITTAIQESMNAEKNRISGSGLSRASRERAALIRQRRSEWR